MQSFHKKISIILAAVICTGGLLQAQTFNEKESIKDQLKKGTAPGLQFAPVNAATVQPVKDNISEIRKKESLIAQIRKGTATGMKFQSGGAAGRTASPARVSQKAVKAGPLASEMEKPRELPKASPAPAVPTQEEAPVAPAAKQ